MGPLVHRSAINEAAEDPCDPAKLGGLITSPLILTWDYVHRKQCSWFVSHGTETLLDVTIYTSNVKS